MKNLKPQDMLAMGIKLLKERKYWDALNAIKSAIEEGGYNFENMPPNYLSYLGLATALAEKRYRHAEELCEMALKQEFYNPLFYLNLGRVYLYGGHKRKAIEIFRNGLRVDKTNKEIMKEIDKMGIRRSPVIPFLPRKNALNKFLGSLLHR